MTLPPEAVLLRHARQALGLSPEEIVKQLTHIRLGNSRWRKIEKGSHVPDDTLAHMSHVAGITPAELEHAGRTEAAEILRRIQRKAQEPTRSPLVEQLREKPAFMRAWNALSPARQRQALRQAEELQRRVDEEEDRARRDLAGYVEALATPGQETSP